MFYLGLFGLLFSFPFEIIYYFCFNGNNEILNKGIIYQIISNSKKESLLNFSLLILFYSFMCVAIILTIYYFTPYHLMVSDMIYVMVKKILYLKDVKKNREIIFIILIIVMSIINVISTLIYSEVIIVKLCSLEKNTAKYISIREKKEYENLDQIYNDGENEEFKRSESISSLSDY